MRSKGRRGWYEPVNKLLHQEREREREAVHSCYSQMFFLFYFNGLFLGWKRKETFRPACCSTRQRELHSVSDYIWSSLKKYSLSLSLSLSRFLVLSSPYRAAGLNSAGEWRRQQRHTNSKEEEEEDRFGFFELLTYLFPGCYFYLFARPSDFSSISFGSFWKRKTNTRTQHINSIVSARLLFLFFKRTRPAQTRPDQQVRIYFSHVSSIISENKLRGPFEIQPSAKRREPVTLYTNKGKATDLNSIFGVLISEKKKRIWIDQLPSLKRFLVDFIFPLGWLVGVPVNLFELDRWVKKKKKVKKRGANCCPFFGGEKMTFKRFHGVCRHQLLLMGDATRWCWCDSVRPSLSSSQIPPLHLLLKSSREFSSSFWKAQCSSKAKHREVVYMFP